MRPLESLNSERTPVNPRLSRRRLRAPAALLVAVLLSAPATKAQNVATQPLISSCLPPGIQRGTQAVWEVHGTSLGRVDRADLEGSGITTRIVRVANDLAILEATATPDAHPGIRELRLSGPDGITNALLVRVDDLLQVREREPNDQPDRATAMPVESAAVGVLEPADIDWFRISGESGQRVTIDLEARRLGVPVHPVVSVYSAEHQALGQFRETPGIEGDCRFSMSLPADGVIVAQVKDGLYQGGNGLAYRLRATSQPYATAMFPLGGPAGGRVRVRIFGGTLAPTLARSEDAGESRCLDRFGFVRGTGNVGVGAGTTRGRRGR